MSINKSFGDIEIFAGDTGRPKVQSLPYGSNLGEYKIIRLLGRGGMGEVYEVEHSTLCRRYALKVLPADFAAMPGAVERFRREARVMANLEHPNILRVDEFGETSGRYWLRMELARGVEVNGGIASTLAEFTEFDGGRIDQVIFIPILYRILRAMSYAHSRGVVHRDLKPSNILLEKVRSSKDTKAQSNTSFSALNSKISAGDRRPTTDDFLIKISDFGLVRLVGEEWIRSQVEISVKHSMTMGDMRTIGAGSQGASTKSLIGTYEYMSPEQKRGEDADKRSDVYALGLMCYRLLTGRNLSMKKPSAIIPSLVSGLDDFISKAVEEDAGDRYADAVEMREELKEIFGESLLEAEANEFENDVFNVPDGFHDGAGVKSGLWANSGCAREIVHDATGIEMVYISSGEFVMGSDQGEQEQSIKVGNVNYVFKFDETPHQIKLSKGYYIGKYEVTQGQWEKVMGNNPSDFRNSGKDAPVECVSWDDCQEFCRKMGSGFRLPTEAEWEYAARGGNKSKGFIYSGSNNLDDVGWYDLISDEKTHPVGQKKPNELGIYDMSGNVWEWCSDWYGDYPADAVMDPTGASSGSDRVCRGGCWFGYAKDCRAARRDGGAPDCRGLYLGLRLAFTPQ